MIYDAMGADSFKFRNRVTRCRDHAENIVTRVSVMDTAFNLAVYGALTWCGDGTICPKCCADRLLSVDHIIGATRNVPLIITPTINPVFSRENALAGRITIDNYDAIRERVILCKNEFFLPDGQTQIQHFSLAGGAVTAACRNRQCLSCGSNSVRPGKAGIIIRTRARGENIFTLLCDACSGDIVKYYRTMFLAVNEVMEALRG